VTQKVQTFADFDTPFFRGQTALQIEYWNLSLQLDKEDLPFLRSFVTDLSVFSRSWACMLVFSRQARSALGAFWLCRIRALRMIFDLSSETGRRESQVLML
jgi:hypothetical protein